MTAQVFSNGQAPTFYVSQVLTPSGTGGANANFDTTTTRLLTVTGTGAGTSRTASITTDSTLVAPLLLSSPAGSLSSGVAVAVGPGAPKGAVSANGTTSSFDIGSAAGSNYNTGIFSNGTLRVSIPSTGIASDAAPSTALTLAGTELRTTPAASGFNTTTWTTVTGYTAAPTNVSYIWQRFGNVVQCQFTAYNVSIASGSNTALIGLPVARVSAFLGLPEECSGSLVAIAGNSAQHGFVTPSPATTNTAVINFVTGSISVATIRGMFSYRLA